MNSNPDGSWEVILPFHCQGSFYKYSVQQIVRNGDSKTYEKELFGEEFEDGNISFGALERANKGTLLIDEVSEIPYETQANVLRVLIDQKFKRINGSNDINVNVRLICSTSKDLKKEIEVGNFREDLFHRLNVFEINIKSLNERISDIPFLEYVLFCLRNFNLIK